MNKILLASLALGLSGCQLASPIFVDYYGVRRDAAKWINSQSLLSMQQKRSLAQLSKAQQQLYNYSSKDSAAQLAIAKENQIALHCAHLHLTDKKIAQLQDVLFAEKKPAVLSAYQALAPMIKLDEKSIQCE